MIGVIDYGVANVRSMLNMLRKVGAEAAAVSDAAGVASVTKLILPGIGAFDQGITALAERGLVEPITRRVRVDRVPILGVCLGMQLLGRGSEEGTKRGLDLLPGTCARFRFDAESGLKVPHMGWATLSPRHPSALLEGLNGESRFYFVHSYHLVCDRAEDVLATADYGTPFTAMVQRDNVYGAQFHPEKSHRYGMALLANFARL